MSTPSLLDCVCSEKIAPKGFIPFGHCRGFVTADVLEKGLSRGAIATGLLEGVKADTKTRGFYTSSAPSMKVKAYV